MKESEHQVDSEAFMFTDLHPKIKIGTASDRYAGWIGQIYTDGKYKLSARTHKVGNKYFKEESLPIESVQEYFRHFSILEIDFTFYRPLLSKDLKPTSNYGILQGYQKYLKNGDGIILKVPQVIFAKKIWQTGKKTENPNYLNADMFTNQFYDPAIAILGDNLIGFIFEQEYLHRADRIQPPQYIAELENFFKVIPKDNRYHVEIRTDFYHAKSFFEVIQQQGIGYVISHWTWLPPIRKQFIKAKKIFYNAGKQCIVRLLTPLRVNYQESYAQAFPFDKMVPGMMNPEMISDAVEIINKGLMEGVTVNIIVNNRAGGNAPLIARELAGRFMESW